MWKGNTQVKCQLLEKVIWRTVSKKFKADNKRGSLYSLLSNAEIRLKKTVLARAVRCR